MGIFHTFVTYIGQPIRDTCFTCESCFLKPLAGTRVLTKRYVNMATGLQMNSMSRLAMVKKVAGCQLLGPSGKEKKRGKKDFLKEDVAAR